MGLAEIVHHPLVDDVGQVLLDHAHGAVGHDQRTLLDPGVLQHRRRRFEPRGIDDDVGALDAGLPIVGGDDLLAQCRADLGGKGVAAFLATRVHADLVEVVEPVHQLDVPERGAAGADMAEDLRALAGEIFGADGGDGTGPHRRDGGGVDHRDWPAGLGIGKIEHRHLGRQVVPVVVEEVADDLDAGEPQGMDHAAQHVEMTARRALFRHQVHARLDDRLAFGLGDECAFDGRDDLVVGHGEGFDVAAMQVVDVDVGHRGRPRVENGRRCLALAWHQCSAPGCQAKARHPQQN